jgi:hypothetical protein
VETASDELVLAASSDNEALIPAAGLVLGGSGGARDLSLSAAPNRSGSARITLTVTDGSGASRSSVFTVTVDNPNDAPSISLIADQVLPEDGRSGALAFTVGDADTGTDGLILTVSSDNALLLPASSLRLAGTGANRSLTLIPAADRSGTARVTLEVTDPSGARAQTAFTLTVTAVNDLPQIGAVPDQLLAEDGSRTDLAIRIADVETPADALLLDASADNPSLLPAAGIQLSGSGATRLLALVPAADQSGSTLVTLSLRDGDGGVVQTQFRLTVSAVNDRPTLVAPGDQTLAEDASSAPLAIGLADAETPAADLQLLAVSDNPTLLPASSLILGGRGASRSLVLRPVAQQSGSARVRLRVTDAEGLVATSDFSVTVTAVNDRPTITPLPDLTLAEDSRSAPLAFSIGDVETAATALTVTASSDNAALLPEGALSLSGTRSEERRVGKECRRLCRSRWSPYH